MYFAGSYSVEKGYRKLKFWECEIAFQGFAVMKSAWKNPGEVDRLLNYFILVNDEDPVI